MGTNRNDVPDLQKRAGALLSKAWREANGKKQGEAAALLDIGQGTLSDWEASRKEPGLELAFRYETLSGGSVPARAWSVTWRQWQREHKKAG